jgi:hypothetical protein
MEYIKNITNNNLPLVPLGIILAPGELREMSEFASRSKLQDYASYFNDKVYLGEIIIVDAAMNQYSKVESVQYFSNAFSKVTIDYNASKSYNNYYFLKDTISLKKNEYIDKFFKGRLKSLSILSKNSTVDIMITTGEGVELPADNLIKRQELSFDFDGDLQNAKLRIQAEGHTEVDIFMEGWNNEFSPEELQHFVHSWYANEELWKTEKAVIVSYVNNSSNIVNPSIIEGTNTLKIDDKKEKDPENNDFYRIYKVTKNEYEVELLESNFWSTWSPNRYFVRAKNITHIEFEDETVDLSAVTLNSYLDHDADKKD